VRADDLLDQIEDRAHARLREDLKSLQGELGIASASELVRRHPALILTTAALAGAAVAPLLARLLRSPARTARLIGFAAPFVKDVLGISSSQSTLAKSERRSRAAAAHGSAIDQSRLR